MTAYPYAIEILLTLMVGACAGSFVTMASHRLPHGKDIVFKSSHCPHCETTLGLGDLVPIFSWVFLRGRCRYCGAVISPRYPLIEVATACMFLLVYLRFGITEDALIVALLAVLLMILVVIDLEYLIIPDGLQIALFLLGFAYRLFLEPSWEAGVIGGTTGLALGLALHYGYLYFRKLDALGMGDVKFFLVAGWWLGPGALVVMLAMAGLMGTVMGLLWGAGGRGQKFPFGPALAAALFICVIGKSTLASWSWTAPLYQLGMSAQ